MVGSWCFTCNRDNCHHLRFNSASANSCQVIFDTRELHLRALQQRLEEMFAEARCPKKRWIDSVADYIFERTIRKDIHKPLVSYSFVQKQLKWLNRCLRPV